MKYSDIGWNSSVCVLIVRTIQKPLQTGLEYTVKSISYRLAGLTARFSFVCEDVIDYPIAGDDP
jgi:hypothetical protein